MDPRSIHSLRKKLTAWYDGARRDLPWRRTRDPYAIWISEIMLQQTRVAAVIPYYERFLARFPDAPALAAAPEEELLTLWAGLGYYSRARNLQKAARQIAEGGGFPRDYAGLLELAGVGAYTAAAIASIAYDLPHAVVDGNVKRVVARLLNNGDADPQGTSTQIAADALLDREHPARWNQAVMELGATICLPRTPRCEECPVAKHCAARRAGTQNQIPSKRVKPEPEYLQRTLLLIQREERILLTPSTRVAGFWDLPEPGEGVRVGATLGSFTHTITHRHYRFAVQEAKVRGTAHGTPQGCRWFALAELAGIPLGTTTKKALRIYTASLGD